eukprot:PhF_6_TR30893/c1_g1_i1/m.45441
MNCPMVCNYNDVSSTCTWSQYLDLCPALREVIVKVNTCENMTIEDFKAFETIPIIVELDFENTKITDVAHLSGCRALRKLNVSSCGTLTNAVIRSLEVIPTLNTGLSLIFLTHYCDTIIAVPS